MAPTITSANQRRLRVNIEKKIVKIVWEQSVYFGTVPVFCTLCGKEARPVRSGTNQLLIAVIYDRHGTVYGEACHNCIALGSEGIKALIAVRIETLQAKLFELDAIAQDDLQLPSVEQEFHIHRRDCS